MHVDGRNVTTSKQEAFTLIELLVVIAIIALLMSILMPALQRVKKQARTAACLTQLKQWGLYFLMYTQEYDDCFMQGWAGVAGGGNNRWVRALGEYHKWNSDFACCPNATKPWLDEYGNNLGLAGTFRGSTTAWGYYKRTGWLKPMKGSYGINGWCNNPDPGKNPHGESEENFWRSPSVSSAGYIPLFLGAQRYNSWPHHTDQAPAFDGQIWNNDAQMGRYCLDRHDGFVGCLLLDWSARKVGLKELWGLKWHRSFDTNYPPPVWPEWMGHFKEL